MKEGSTYWNRGKWGTRGEESVPPCFRKPRDEIRPGWELGGGGGREALIKVPAEGMYNSRKGKAAGWKKKISVPVRVRAKITP